MKVKFIEENPDWYLIGIRDSDNYLILNDIYDAEHDPDGYFGDTGWKGSFDIYGFSYPIQWFQIIKE